MPIRNARSTRRVWIGDCSRRSSERRRGDGAFAPGQRLPQWMAGRTPGGCGDPTGGGGPGRRRMGGLRMDVYQEHRATQLCLVALHELQQGSHRRPTGSGRWQSAAAPRATPLSCTLLAQLTLMEAGWNAVDVARIRRPLRSARPSANCGRCLWLSSTHLADPERFLSEYRDLYREAEAATGGRRGRPRPDRRASLAWPTRRSATG